MPFPFVGHSDLWPASAVSSSCGSSSSSSASSSSSSLPWVPVRLEKEIQELDELIHLGDFFAHNKFLFPSTAGLNSKAPRVIDAVLLVLSFPQASRSPPSSTPFSSAWWRPPDSLGFEPFPPFVSPSELCAAQVNALARPVAIPPKAVSPPPFSDRRGTWITPSQLDRPRPRPRPPTIDDDCSLS